MLYLAIVRSDPLKAVTGLNGDQNNGGAGKTWGFNSTGGASSELYDRLIQRNARRNRWNS